MSYITWYDEYDLVAPEAKKEAAATEKKSKSCSVNF